MVLDFFPPWVCLRVPWLSPGGATGDVTGGATGGANHGHGREYGAEVDHFQLPAHTYWFETILGSIQAARLAANTTMGKHSWHSLDLVVHTSSFTGKEQSSIFCFFAGLSSFEETFWRFLLYKRVRFSAERSSKSLYALGGFALTEKIEFLPYLKALNTNPPILLFMKLWCLFRCCVIWPVHWERLDVGCLFCKFDTHRFLLSSKTISK